MIKVKYQIQDKRYRSLEVSGHADSDEHGKDLVCASVSSIIFGLANALDELDEDVEIKKLKNSFIITNNSNSDVVENYLELVITQLKTIEFPNKEYIKVERK